MNRTIAVKILSGAVALAGLFVSLGWILGVPAFESILPIWPVMHFTTGVSFLLAGIAVYLIAELILEEKQEIAAVILPFVAPLILLAIGVLLAIDLFYPGSSLEGLFVQDVSHAAFAGTVGFPPVGSIVSFILVSVITAFSLYDRDGLDLKLFLAGSIVSLTGGLALVGHFLNVPLLYYSLFGWSSAMPFNTAFLFLMLGTGMVLIQPSSSQKQ